MLKKLFPVLLCLALLLTVPVAALAEEKDASITISTPEELLRFAENCRLDSYSRGLRAELTTDIDLSGLDFQGIPIFSGSFDGGGHTVSGLNITGDGSVMGFFRYLTEEAVVTEIKLAGNVTPGGSRATVGALAGSNAGKIENCSFSGKVSGSDSVGGLVGINTVTGIIENCTVTGTVDGNHFVGGIAGENTGVIRSCGNEALVNTTPQQNTVEISEITIDTLTGSESAATVTDIGGIAGTSSGVIRDCENRGDVGYKHMGYNVGGIVGSQAGFVTGCDNYGAVSGRKEAGGIVGHLEPGIRMEFSEDTLQALKEQMDTLGQLTGNAAASAQGGAAAISGQVGAIRDHAQTAQNALEQLVPSVTPPEDGLLPDISLPDPDSIQAAQNALSGSVTGMQSSLEGLMSAAQGAAGALSSSMQAISGQVEKLTETINGASENLGGTIRDVSDEDTREDTTGKVAECENYGAVLADLNAGGIVGAMALETDLDPEADVSISGDTSLNFESMLRAVVLDCVNQGSVTAKKQNTGGIAGWMDMGLVKNCVNTGHVEGGDYTGGIAGRSSGFIRDSSVKCMLSGDSCVGGIAGQAEVATDCRSMVALDAREKAGAVLGSAEVGQEISGNFYLAVGKDPGAIDGISYDGSARGLEKKAFLALKGVPQTFRRVTVRFLFEDGSETEVTVPLGNELPLEDIPEIPEKAGHTGSWEGLEAGSVLFDTVYRAVYTPFRSVIESQEQRQDGKPILLAEGSFPPEAEITVIFSQELPEQTDSIVWQSENLQVMALSPVSNVLEVLDITVPEDCGPVVYRYLPPESGKTDAILLVRNDDGSWKQLQAPMDGSYLVFDALQGRTVIALVETEAGLPRWSFAAIGGAVVLGVILTAIFVKKRKAA